MPNTTKTRPYIAYILYALVGCAIGSAMGIGLAMRESHAAADALVCPAGTHASPSTAVVSDVKEHKSAKY